MANWMDKKGLDFFDEISDNPELKQGFRAAFNSGVSKGMSDDDALEAGRQSVLRMPQAATWKQQGATWGQQVQTPAAPKQVMGDPYKKGLFPMLSINPNNGRMTMSQVQDAFGLTGGKAPSQITQDDRTAAAWQPSELEGEQYLDSILGDTEKMALYKPAYNDVWDRTQDEDAAMAAGKAAAEQPMIDARTAAQRKITMEDAAADVKQLMSIERFNQLDVGDQDAVLNAYSTAKAAGRGTIDAMAEALQGIDTQGKYGWSLFGSAAHATPAAPAAADDGTEPAQKFTFDFSGTQGNGHTNTRQDIDRKISDWLNLSNQHDEMMEERNSLWEKDELSEEEKYKFWDLDEKTDVIWQQLFRDAYQIAMEMGTVDKLDKFKQEDEDRIEQYIGGYMATYLWLLGYGYDANRPDDWSKVKDREAVEQLLDTLEEDTQDLNNLGIAYHFKTPGELSGTPEPEKHFEDWYINQQDAIMLKLREMGYSDFVIEDATDNPDKYPEDVVQLVDQFNQIDADYEAWKQEAASHKERAGVTLGELPEIAQGMLGIDPQGRLQEAEYQEQMDEVRMRMERISMNPDAYDEQGNLKRDYSEQYQALQSRYDAINRDYEAWKAGANKPAIYNAAAYLTSERGSEQLAAMGRLAEKVETGVGAAGAMLGQLVWGFSYGANDLSRKFYDSMAANKDVAMRVYNALANLFGTYNEEQAKRFETAYGTMAGIGGNLFSHFMETDKEKLDQAKKDLYDNIYNFLSTEWEEGYFDQYNDVELIQNTCDFLSDYVFTATGVQMGEQWPTLLISLFTHGADKAAAEGAKGLFGKIGQMIRKPEFWATFGMDYIGERGDRYRSGENLTDIDHAFLIMGSLVNAGIEIGLGGDDSGVEGFFGGTTGLLKSAWEEMVEEWKQDPAKKLFVNIADLLQGREARYPIYSNNMDDDAMFNLEQMYQTGWQTFLTTIGMDTVKAATFGPVGKLLARAEYGQLRRGEQVMLSRVEHAVREAVEEKQLNGEFEQNVNDPNAALKAAATVRVTGTDNLTPEEKAIAEKGTGGTNPEADAEMIAQANAAINGEGQPAQPAAEAPAVEEAAETQAAEETPEAPAAPEIVGGFDFTGVTDDMLQRTVTSAEKEGDGNNPLVNAARMALERRRARTMLPKYAQNDFENGDSHLDLKGLDDNMLQRLLNAGTRNPGSVDAATLQAVRDELQRRSNSQMTDLGTENITYTSPDETKYQQGTAKNFGEEYNNIQETMPAEETAAPETLPDDEVQKALEGISDADISEELTRRAEGFAPDNRFKDLTDDQLKGEISRRYGITPTKKTNAEDNGQAGTQTAPENEDQAPEQAANEQIPGKAGDYNNTNTDGRRYRSMRTTELIDAIMDQERHLPAEARERMEDELSERDLTGLSDADLAAIKDKYFDTGRDYWLPADFAALLRATFDDKGMLPTERNLNAAPDKAAGIEKETVETGDTGAVNDGKGGQSDNTNKAPEAAVNEAEEAQPDNKGESDTAEDNNKEQTTRSKYADADGMELVRALANPESRATRGDLDEMGQELMRRGLDAFTEDQLREIYDKYIKPGKGYELPIPWEMMIREHFGEDVSYTVPEGKDLGAPGTPNGDGTARTPEGLNKNAPLNLKPQGVTLPKSRLAQKLFSEMSLDELRAKLGEVRADEKHKGWSKERVQALEQAYATAQALADAETAAQNRTEEARKQREKKEAAAATEEKTQRRQDEAAQAKQDKQAAAAAERMKDEAVEEGSDEVPQPENPPVVQPAEEPEEQPTAESVTQQNKENGEGTDAQSGMRNREPASPTQGAQPTATQVEGTPAVQAERATPAVKENTNKTGGSTSVQAEQADETVEEISDEVEQPENPPVERTAEEPAEQPTAESVTQQNKDNGEGTDAHGGLRHVEPTTQTGKQPTAKRVEGNPAVQKEPVTPAVEENTEKTGGSTSVPAEQADETVEEISDEVQQPENPPVERAAEEPAEQPTAESVTQQNKGNGEDTDAQAGMRNREPVTTTQNAQPAATQVEGKPAVQKEPVAKGTPDNANKAGGATVVQGQQVPADNRDLNGTTITKGEDMDTGRELAGVETDKKKGGGPETGQVEGNPDGKTTGVNTEMQTGQEDFDEETKSTTKHYGFRLGAPSDNDKNSGGVYIQGSLKGVTQDWLNGMMIADGLAKRDGFKVVAYSNMKPGENGMYISGGRTIYVSTKSTEPVQQVVGHELYHMVKSLNPRSASNIARVFDRYAAGAGMDVERLVDAKIAQYSEHGIKLTREAAKEEIIADSMFTLLSDEQTIRHIYNTDRNLFSRIMDFVRRVNESIKDMLSRYEAKTPQARMLRQQAGALENINKLMLDALEEMRELDPVKKAATGYQVGNTRIEARHGMTKRYAERVREAGNKTDITEAARDLARDVLKVTGNEDSFENIGKLMNASILVNSGGMLPHQALATVGLNQGKNYPAVNDALRMLGNLQNAVSVTKDDKWYNRIMAFAGTENLDEEEQTPAQKAPAALRVSGGERLTAQEKAIADRGSGINPAIAAHPEAAKFSIGQLAQGLGFKVRTDVDGVPFIIVDKNGNQIKNITKEMVEKTPYGIMIEAALQKGTLSAQEADAQREMIARLATMAANYVDQAMVWEIAGNVMFSSIKNNSDKQYGTTVDYGTICTKTQAIIDVLSETMLQKGRGLTRSEILKAYDNTAATGLAVPCPVCYVFSRWVGVPGLLGNMLEFQDRFGAMTEQQVKDWVSEMERKYAPTDKKTTSELINDFKQKQKNRINRIQKQLTEAIKSKDIEARDRLAAEVDRLEADLKDAIAYNWVTQVMCKQNNKVNLRDKNGQVIIDKDYAPVPKEILLDMRRTGDFAGNPAYKKSWTFRNTRGAGMGKGILPYSGARIGDTILNAASSGEKTRKKTNVILNSSLSGTKTAIDRAIKRIKAQNLIGGHRFQSTSDYRPEWGLDYMMTFMEMQAIGAKGQLYTKVIEAVDMFATAGIEVNLSIMGRGKGYTDGADKLTADNFSDITGIDFERALEMVRKYDNVQMILVGLNDQHIRLALKDDRITMVIPWHSSGSSEKMLASLMKSVGENLENGTDYSNSQNDKAIENPTDQQKAAARVRKNILTGKYMDGVSDEDMRVIRGNKYLSAMYDKFYVDETAEDTYHVTLTESQAEQIFPHEYWDTSSDYAHADVNGRRFVEYCELLGLVPRFSQFKDDPGYWKLLIDRKMYNNDGSYHVPRTIKATDVQIGDIAGKVGKVSYGDMDKVDQAVQATLDNIRAMEDSEEYPEESMLETEEEESEVKYSLAAVDPVQTSDESVWQPGHSEAWFRENGFPIYQDVPLDQQEINRDTSKKGHGTQIASTESTYKKLFDRLKKEHPDTWQNMRVLDASSGLGLGTAAGREMGFNVTDIEPFPNASYSPDYTDYQELQRQVESGEIEPFDYIISNAVLNVIPQDTRDNLVAAMGKLLKPGGSIFVNVISKDYQGAIQSNPDLDASRAARKGAARTMEGDYTRSGNANGRGHETFVWGSNSVQKVFSTPELIGYLKDALGDGYTIKRDSIGMTGVLVTKDNDIRYSVGTDQTDAERGEEIYNEALRHAGNGENAYALLMALQQAKRSERQEQYGLWKEHLGEMADTLIAETRSRVYSKTKVERELSRIFDEYEKAEGTTAQDAQDAVGEVLDELQDLLGRMLVDEEESDALRAVKEWKRRGVYLDEQQVKEMGGKEEMHYFRSVLGVPVYEDLNRARKRGAAHLEGSSWDELAELVPAYFKADDDRMGGSHLDRPRMLMEYLMEHQDMTVKNDPQMRDYVARFALETLAEYYTMRDQGDASDALRSSIRRANTRVSTLEKNLAESGKQIAALEKKAKELDQMWRDADMEAFKMENRARRAEQKVTDLQTELENRQQPQGPAPADVKAQVRADQAELQQQLKQALDERRELAKQLNDALKEQDKMTAQLEAKDNQAAYLQNKLRLVKQENEKTMKRAIRDSKERWKKQAEQRAKDANNRRNIKRTSDQLKRMITKPSATSYVPADFIRSLLDLTEAAQLADTRRTSRLGEQFMKRMRALREDEHQAYLANAFDKGFTQMMQEVVDLLGEKTVNQMDSQELQYVSNVFTQAAHQIKNATVMIGRERHADALKEGDDAINVTKAQKGVSDNALLRGAQKLTTEQLRPKTFFRKLAGFKDNAWSRLGEMLNEGQRRQERGKQQLTDAIRSLTEGENAKLFDKFTGKNATLIDTGIKDKNGRDIKITQAQRVSLYLHSLNEQNVRHFIYEATLPDQELLKKGKKEQAYDRSLAMRLIDYYAYHNNDERIAAVQRKLAELTAGMTDYEKAWVAAYQQMEKMSTHMINEVSLQLNGYEKAIVERYFPIKTDKNFLQTDFESIIMDGTITGMGMLKERVNGANPMVIEDVTDVIGRMINNTSLYYGMAIPVRNFNLVYNTTLPGYDDSVKAAVRRTWGSEAADYLERLLGDIQGNGRNEERTFLDAFRSSYAGSVLTLNPSVMMKQAASLPTAAASLGWGPIRRALMSTKRVSPDLINKYTSAYIERVGGGIRDMEANANRNTAIKRGLHRFGNGIQAMDLATVRKVWLASEYYVQEQQPDLERGTDAYYEAVARAFETAVEDTQPEYGVMQRPHILRSKNKLVRSLTMFKTQALQNFNILYEAAGDLQAKRQAYKQDASEKNRQALQESQRQMGRAVSSQIVSAAVLAVMTALGKALLHKPEPYQDDKGEITAASAGYQLSKDAISSLAGMTIGGSELFDLIVGIAEGKQPFDIEAGNVSLLNDLYQSVYKLGNAATAIGDSSLTQDQKRQKIIKAVTQFGQNVGSMYGVPVGNLLKIRDSAVSYVDDILSGRGLEGLTTGDVTLTSAARYMGEALQKGDTATYTRLYNRLLGQGKTESQINSAVKKWIKTNDPRIREAAEAINEGDLDTYNRLVNEMSAAGYGMSNVVGLVEQVRKAGGTEEAEPAEEAGEMTYEQIMGGRNDADASAYTYAQLNQMLEAGNVTAAKKVQSALFKSKGTTGVKSALTSYWKPKYQAAYQSKNRTELNRITKLMKAMGYSDANITKWRQVEASGGATTTASKKSGFGSSGFGKSFGSSKKSSSKFGGGFGGGFGR